MGCSDSDGDVGVAGGLEDDEAAGRVVVEGGLAYEACREAPPSTTVYRMLTPNWCLISCNNMSVFVFYCFFMFTVKFLRFHTEVIVYKTLVKVLNRYLILYKQLNLLDSATS